jgi:hypothetical protein
MLAEWSFHFVELEAEDNGKCPRFPGLDELLFVKVCIYSAVTIERTVVMKIGLMCG